MLGEGTSHSGGLGGGADGGCLPRSLWRLTWLVHSGMLSHRGGRGTSGLGGPLRVPEDESGAP